jgi:CHAT domain-containing protein
VFLSGCETGAAVAVNPYQGGEEYAALAQVLLHAGIRNVIATAWRIEDEPAAEFAKRFYANLAGRSPGDALAAAQREFLRSSALAHPRHWAGYQTSGDGRTVGAHTTDVASVQ